MERKETRHAFPDSREDQVRVNKRKIHAKLRGNCEEEIEKRKKERKKDTERRKARRLLKETCKENEEMRRQRLARGYLRSSWRKSKEINQSIEG